MVSRGVEPEGYTPAPREDMNFGFNLVSEDYFATMRIPLVSGRAFEPRDDTSAPKVAIVNQPFARTFWPGRDPIGRIIEVGGEQHRVVGIVREIKYVNVTEEPRPYVYLPLSVKLAEDPTLRRRPLAIGSASAIVTMVACGLWHGNTPALAVWGLGHGVAIAAHQLYRQRLLAELPARRRKALTQHPAYRAAATSLTFASVTLLWVFFRFPLRDAASVLARLFAVR